MGNVVYLQFLGKQLRSLPSVVYHLHKAYIVAVQHQTTEKYGKECDAQTETRRIAEKVR